MEKTKIQHEIDLDYYLTINDKKNICSKVFEECARAFYKEKMVQDTIESHFNEFVSLSVEKVVNDDKINIGLKSKIEEIINGSDDSLMGKVIDQVADSVNSDLKKIMKKSIEKETVKIAKELIKKGL